MALTLEEIYANVFFQKAKLPGYRWLNAVEELRRARDVTGIGDSHKGAQLLQVHISH
jgi:hypothetical protein